MTRRGELLETVARVTNLTREQICDIPLDEQRELIEKRKGHRLRFRSYFPFIGRGTVLHDRFKNHDEAEKALSEALR